jgi:hypothetical protein
MPICENPILIGGAGSSGTTLLKVLISRHCKIACGPELSIFNKAKFYCQKFSWFQRHAYRILDAGFCTEGWFPYSPTFPFLEEYGWSKEDLIWCINNCSSQREFIDRFYERYLDLNEKTIWAEKTPSNVYCFKYFLKLYPKAKIIHIFRDGRDVIVSMIKKGRNPYEASMAWVYNTSAGLYLRDHPNYKEIKYESLVTEPEAVLNDLFNFLQLEFQSDILKPDKNAGKKDHNSWKNSPHDRISMSSIGQYRSEMTSFDWAAFRSVKISRTHIQRFDLSYDNSEQILEYFGFDRSEEPPLSGLTGMEKLRLIKLLVLDFGKRLLNNWRIDKAYRPYPGMVSFR